MTTAVDAAAIALAVVFAWAAIAKLLRREQTADAFGSLGLRKPADLATTVPIVGFIAASLLLTRPFLGGLVALFLLVAFTVVLVAVVRRDIPVSCACFGSVSSRASDPVSWRSLARNGVLIALALVVLVGAPATFSAG